MTPVTTQSKHIKIFIPFVSLGSFRDIQDSILLLILFYLNGCTSGCQHLEGQEFHSVKRKKDVKGSLFDTTVDINCQRDAKEMSK